MARASSVLPRDDHDDDGDVLHQNASEDGSQPDRPVPAGITPAYLGPFSNSSSDLYASESL